LQDVGFERLVEAVAAVGIPRGVRQEGRLDGVSVPADDVRRSGSAAVARSMNRSKSAKVSERVNVVERSNRNRPPGGAAATAS
jgi:hypothetical protein